MNWLRLKRFPKPGFALPVALCSLVGLGVGECGMLEKDARVFQVINSTQHAVTLHFVGSSGPFKIGAVEPGEQTPIRIPPPDVDPNHEDGCTSLPLVAKANGDEVDRLDPPICVDQTWTVEEGHE